MTRLPMPLALVGLLAVPAAGQPPAKLATPEEMAASREDLWGEAAIRQPGGPSYEFFRDLLPPLRYVNTAFRHYPIVLCAPGSPVKARFVSNGSGINLRADKLPMWKEAGVPVSFFVGEKAEPFGADVEKLGTPRYTSGFLPVIVVRYQVDGVNYQQAAFAPTTPELANHGVVLVEFRKYQSPPGRVVVRVAGEVKAAEGAILDEKGRTLIRYGPNWKWDAGKKEMVAGLDEKQSAELAVFTVPPEEQVHQMPSFRKELEQCSADWETLVNRGAGFGIPEGVVAAAWRPLIVGNFLAAVGDRMHYSAGNAYDHLYEAECGDAVRSMMLYGFTADARRMIGPLLDFNRQATRFHVAGHKLQLLAHYYWVTRDKEYLKESRAKWDPVIAFIRENRKTDNGLLPKDRYAGDIAELVYSLNSNAACWRGLRDMAAVLVDMGETDLPAELRKEAAEFRKAILAAVDRSQVREAKFIPVSLLSGEKPHDPLTATRTGSYYDLIIPYVLGSGVFGPGDDREGWIIDYLRTHGGLAMGMIRSMPHQGEFDKQPGVNVLYGLRYNLTLLRRGDRDHALVGFYGHLAQGMTRGTFIGGEGSRFFHGDKHGRSFYLPPNTAANATFLTTLRYLLIQDWDLDDDGKPETLRLLDAIPPQWVKHRQTIDVRKAPTAFGPVSVRVTSESGDFRVEVEAPPRPVGKFTLRLPEPPGYTITGVRIGKGELKRDADGRVDLTGRTGTFDVWYTVKPK